jgi:hypothetical protein
VEDADGEVAATTPDDDQTPTRHRKSWWNWEHAAALYLMITCAILLCSAHSMSINLNECFELLRRQWCRNYDNILGMKMTFSPKNFVELPVKELSAPTWKS